MGFTWRKNRGKAKEKYKKLKELKPIKKVPATRAATQRKFYVAHRQDLLLASYASYIEHAEDKKASVACQKIRQTS